MRVKKFSWISSPPDLWNLLNLSIEELVIIYDEIPKSKIIGTRSVYRVKIRDGELEMPPKNPEYDGNPEAERERAKGRRKAVAPNAGQAATSRLISIQVLEEHLHYHEAVKKQLEEDGYLSKVTFTDWQMGSKDEDGNPQVTDLHGTRFEVKFDSEPKWVPVNRVESVRLPKKEKKTEVNLPKTDIIADLQWPFVDRQALDVALQIERDRQPDTLIIGGDLMDLSAWSKYQQFPEWATVTQQSINEIHQFLVTLRKMLPATRIIVVEGNHEKRIPDTVLNNAKAAYGLKRADQPENWPVLSVPYLTAMDTLDIEYHDGFPANNLWITPNLQFKHRAPGRTPTAVANNERYSTIYGDNHRIESAYKTYPTIDGATTYGVFGVGALCRLDGHTPGSKSGRHLDGTPVTAYNDNWQHGIMLVDHHPDGSFNTNQIFIDTFNGYKAIYNGKVYTPNDVRG